MSDNIDIEQINYHLECLKHHLSQATAPSPIEEIGKRIKKARKEQGLSRSRLASQIGIAEPTIAKIEAGEHNVIFDSVIVTARALGLKIWVG